MSNGVFQVNAGSLLVAFQSSYNEMD